MNVEIHIDRLVLDGVQLDPTGQRLLGAALRAELTRLIAQGGVQSSLPGVEPRMTAAPIAIGAGCGPLQMGVQLARSVYGGIGKPGK